MVAAECSNVSSWLKADIQPPQIEVRFTPKSGHSEAHAGLPLTPPVKAYPLTCYLQGIAIDDPGRAGYTCQGGCCGPSASSVIDFLIHND